MLVFTDPKREVIYHVLELLPSIEEALLHMQIQLAQLRLKESAILFKDASDAISEIANCLPPLLDCGSETSLPVLIASIREGISMVIDAYERSNLT